MPAAAGVSLSLADIAARLGGDVLGDPQTLICQVATLISAGEGEESLRLLCPFGDLA